ncbi:MAG: hypothetical protein KC419_27010 [Anaerolineales bacterium]|nr:hypothetical protein [Anaerolineales bacterium]MCA9932175.1 hypothetical protein [Anaerolineales bacterium]
MEDLDLFQDDDFSEEASVFEDEQPSGFDDDLDFDSLRRQSARSGSAFDDMETGGMEDDGFEGVESEGGSRFSLGNFTPGQRLILAILILLDIVAVLFGVLVITGRFSL